MIFTRLFVPTFIRDTLNLRVWIVHHYLLGVKLYASGLVHIYLFVRLAICRNMLPESTSLN
jgi:hypothetical protein